jgi:hypothetical protein
LQSVTGEHLQMTSDPHPAQRNKEVFANANERIRLSAELVDFDEAVPFLCECSESTCTEIVQLSLENYREVRERGQAFILRPGHEDANIERVTGRRDGYVLVEKIS